MKEYKYTIIRRESRNPKRNREGRGISQSDIEALKQELAGESRGIISAITDRDLALDNLTSSVGDLTLTSTDLSQRLKIAEESVQSHGKTLSGQAQALASQAQLLADQGQRLTTQGESLTDQSQRLTTAEQALTDKLDSGEFGKWQREELAKALASKQPAGSYALTSELATSQQQAVAEAVKRAGEMDKQIKVGGRNLIVTSRWKAGYLYGDRDENAYPVGSENYKVLVGYDTFRFDPVYIPTLGEREVTYKLYDNGGETNGTVQIHAYDKDKKFLWWSCDGWDGTIGHTNAWTLPADTAYIRLGVKNENVRAKVEFGTVVTDWTPAPEDVEESVRTVNTSVTSLTSQLLDPDQGEIHKLTSQLATSQQQAVDEAVRQAGEMDKQIKVGGRNLLIGERFSKETTPSKEIWLGNITSIIDNNNLIGETVTWSFDLKCDKAYTFNVYQLGTIWFTPYTIATVEAGEWKRVSFTGVVRDTDNPTGSTDRNCILVVYGDYDSGYFPITRHHKLERGTISTDWTPAPEDVEESVSKVNTSVTSLASQLESHKTATDKSFEDLATHPLTIDDNGYWKIWNVKDSQYVTTQYQSRGEAGHTPELHVGEDDYLYIDGVQQRYIRGRQGEPGHSPKPDEVLSTDSFRQQLTSKVTSEVTTQVAPVNQRLESIDDKAEEARTIGSNAQRTANDMTDQVRLAMSGVTDLKNFRTSATSQLSDLDKRSLTTQQKSDLSYLTYSLQSLKSTGNSTLDGLALQRLIALSSDNQTVTAYLASNTLGAVLKAGITGFGTPNEREQVEITHQGTGHFGNLYFNGGQIDFKTGRDAAPYLSIGAEESDFIDTFLNNARVIDTPVSISTLTLTSSLERSVSVANDGTRLTIRLDKISVDVYAPSSLRLTLDGETLAEWWGSAKYIDTSGRDEGGMSYKIERTPYEASNLSYERVVKAGNHTVRLEIVKPSGGRATVTGFRVRRRYDTGAQQSVLTKSGLRLFASPDRYFDIDYRKSVWDSAPNRLSQWISNPYLVRIKGGAKVDYLTADELDAPGVPLCGASFNEQGGQIKAFGKYVNQRGYSRAQAEYDNGMAAFKVYHSIGHTNYIPIVQVSGFASNDINWSLTPRVYNITSEYFVVRILTNNDNPTARGISYVAYKTM